MLKRVIPVLEAMPDSVQFLQLFRFVFLVIVVRNSRTTLLVPQRLLRKVLMMTVPMSLVLLRLPLIVVMLVQMLMVLRPRGLHVILSLNL